MRWRRARIIFDWDATSVRFILREIECVSPRDVSRRIFRHSLTSFSGFAESSVLSDIHFINSPRSSPRSCFNSYCLSVYSSPPRDHPLFARRKPDRARPMSKRQFWLVSAPRVMYNSSGRNSLRATSAARPCPSRPYLFALRPRRIIIDHRWHWSRTRHMRKPPVDGKHSRFAQLRYCSSLLICITMYNMTNGI